MDKKSVLLYLDSLNVLDSLTDEQAGKLIKKIRAYSAGLEYDPKEQLIDVVFIQFRNYIDANTKKYNGICEKNKDNVRKRWYKENTTVYDRIPNDTKNTDKDTDTDTDKDIDKDTDKKKDNGFTPPSISDVENYFTEKGYKKEVGTKAYEFYSASGRIDTKGNKIKNRKQKMIGVRFKEDNKSIPAIEPTDEKEKGQLYVQIGRKKYIELFGLDNAVQANKFKNIYGLSD